MIEQQDHVQAAEIMRLFNLCGTKMSGGEDYQTLLRQLSAHRQQAEDAMRERCLRICETTVVEVPLTNGACDGASIALHTIATAIRGIDAGGEGE